MVVAKTCAKCKTPKALQAFDNQAAGKHGRRSTCKECRHGDYERNKEMVSIKGKERYQRNKERIKRRVREYALRNKETVADRQRRYAATHRAERNEANRRYRKRHKAVLSLRWKAHYREYREEILAKGREYRVAHPGKQVIYYAENRLRILEYQAQYRETHKSVIYERDKRYRETHKASLFVKKKIYRQNNPGKIVECRHRYRAKKHNLQEYFPESYKRFVHSFWDHKCASCDSIDDLCIDHWMPLSRGYPLAMGNAVLLCRRCNSRKRDHLPWDIFQGAMVVEIEARLFEQVAEWLTRKAG